MHVYIKSLIDCHAHMLLQIYQQIDESKSRQTVVDSFYVIRLFV